MQSIIAHAKSLGAVVSVNHPECPLCPYKWEDDEAYDMIEIWNGPMRGTNVRGITKWTFLLSQGRQIPAVGGSDYHKPKQFAKLGNPVTAVYSKSRSAEDILDAIKNGNCFIAENKDCVKIRLNYGDAVMGQTAEYKENEWLEIFADTKKVTLVTDKGEKELTLKDGHLKVRLKKVKFAYVKVHKGFGKLKRVCAISNPIYFK